MSNLYELRLAVGFTGQRRRRAGIELEPGVTLKTELTEEQLKAVEADEWITVNAAGKGSEKELQEPQKPDYYKMKRGKLEKIAVKLGIDPALHSNIPKLAAAIEKAEAQGIPTDSTLEYDGINLGVTEEAFNAMTLEEQNELLRSKGIDPEKVPQES